MPLRVAFMGSPPFAVPALLGLHGAGHAIVAVYTQPPRPAGRGQRTRPSAVQRAAEALGLPVRSPARLRREATEWEAFAALDLDVAVVAAYGLLLPPAMLAAPRRGCLNIHASLLPRWRGAAPIQAAILAGDAETGITIMQMEEGLDTGPMLLREAMPIAPRTTAPELTDSLSVIGARLILDALAHPAPALAQPDRGITHAAKLTRAAAALDWRQPAAALDARVRALDPWPGTSFAHGTESIRVLAAEAFDAGAADAVPGTVLEVVPELRPAVACGTGALRLLRLQRAGRGPLPGAEFLRGHPLPPGTVLA